MNALMESETGVHAPGKILVASYPAKWEQCTREQIDALGPMGLMAAGGLSVCPIATDGTKRPTESWKKYARQIANPIQVASWAKQGLGYAIICGLISFALEVLDFDAGELYAPWYWECQAIIERYRLPIVATPSGGFHVYWRCTEISGNQKLAKSEDGNTLIETRGEAGFACGILNPRKVHRSGKLYLQIGGVDLPHVPTITPADRMHLLRAAIAFDRFGLRKKAIEDAAKREASAKWKSSNPNQSGFRVGDSFKSAATWPEVLEPHGWTYAGGTYWTRPGGDSGAHSASINCTDGVSVLTVFSGNAGPLAPTTGDHATWDLFSAYAALNHNGDRKAAARELKTQGYGA